MKKKIKMPISIEILIVSMLSIASIVFLSKYCNLGYLSYIPAIIGGVHVSRKIVTPQTIARIVTFFLKK